MTQRASCAIGHGAGLVCSQRRVDLFEDIPIEIVVVVISEHDRPHEHASDTEQTAQ